MRYLLVVLVLVFLAPAGAAAQGWNEDHEDRPPSHAALNLGANGYGLSIGNSARWNGLRINWRDAELDRINGVNITLWAPHDEVGGTVTGLSLGVSPVAAELNGLNVGLVAAVADNAMRGVN
ncbi:MAG: hypothetical protein P8174_08710, partial [Gemmatimonadota bacterium]